MKNRQKIEKENEDFVDQLVVLDSNNRCEQFMDK